MSIASKLVKRLNESDFGSRAYFDQDYSYFKKDSKSFLDNIEGEVEKVRDLLEPLFNKDLDPSDKKNMEMLYYRLLNLKGRVNSMYGSVATLLKNQF